MSILGVVFHIWCKRLVLFWSVRGLNIKIPTFPTCQLGPLSPNLINELKNNCISDLNFTGTVQWIQSWEELWMDIVPGTDVCVYACVPVLCLKET
jgi:hypothetical protein